MSKHSNIQGSYATKSVLVIDPTESVRTTITTMLFELGFGKVIQASKISQAKQYLNEKTFDVIISEHLPVEFDGINLLQSVRNTPNTALVPFIIVSANILQQQVIQAIQSGVSEFIVKPFTMKAFKERLSRAIVTPLKASALRAKSIDNNFPTPIKTKPASILVVDDIPDNIQIITEVIKKDYRVKAATSGEQALRVCLSNNPPDLILLDIMMPEIDGLTVCKELKSNPLTQHITVIFVTAKDRTEDVIKGLTLGAVDYITKPINPQILKARIATHIKIATANKLLREQVDTMVAYAELRAEFDHILHTDLKQPIQALADNIQQLSTNKNAPEQIENISNTVKSTCNELVSFIDNLSVLHQVEDNIIELKTTAVDCMKLVQQAWGTLDSTVSHKKLLLDTNSHTKEKILADVALFEIIVYQLLKNAIEAAPEKSTITISQKYKENKVTLSIHNLGNIPSKIESTFFEKQTSLVKKEGIGLGTYKAKLMTEILNGDIWFNSSPTSGTTLFLAFYCAPS